MRQLCRVVLWLTLISNGQPHLAASLVCINSHFAELTPSEANISIFQQANSATTEAFRVAVDKRTQKVERQKKPGDPDDLLRIAELLDKGADINARLGEDKLTPLEAAMMHRDEPLRDLLLERGADLNALDIGGNTAIFYALRYGGEFLKMLFDKGANVDAINASGDTILFKAAEGGNNPGVPNTGQELLKVILAQHPNIHIRNDKGMTALMVSASVGDATTVRRLLAMGAEVNARDKEGRAALMDAAFRGDMQSCMILLDNKADVQARDNAGNTVVMLCGKPVILAELLRRGVDVNAVNNKGETALMLRAHDGYEYSSAFLLKNKADVRRRDKTGWTALMYAINGGNILVVKALLQAGSHVNARAKNSEMPLKLAKYWTNANMIRLLKRFGAR